MILDKLQNLVDQLNETTSSNEKKEILAKGADKEIQSLFKLIYGSIEFGITSDGIKKAEKMKSEFEHEDSDDDIESILQKLHARTYTGYNATTFVNQYISRHEKHRDLIYNIIDKNLKCRIDTSMINKVFPNLIPEFECALANDYFKRKDVNFDKDVWYASHKLDGLRCITIIEDGVVSCYSRNGKEFQTLDVLKKHLEKLGLDNVVFDGEICIVDENDDEDFQTIMKEYNKKGHTISTPRYKVFDMLSLEEFYSKSSKRILSERISAIKKVIKSDKIIDILEQIKIKDQKHFKELFDMAIENFWEGLIKNGQ